MLLLCGMSPGRGALLEKLRDAFVEEAEATTGMRTVRSTPTTT